MKCLRVYADEKGESHFSEMEIAMSNSQLVPSHTIQRSTPAVAANIQFLTFPPTLPSPPLPPSPSSSLFSPPFLLLFLSLSFSPAGVSNDWHPAPARQFVISLDRTFEIETSDGQRRQVQPSSVIFVQDTWGKGHKTRSVGDHAGTLIFVPLAGDGLR